MAGGEVIAGFSWENRRRQVALTLLFCRGVYAAVLALYAGDAMGLYEVGATAHDGLKAVLTANTAVYVPTVASYLFGPVAENRAIAASRGTPK